MKRYKYPRTYHLPYSEGYTSDDKVLDFDDIFKEMKVVVTEKMDGENTTVYRDFVHARSIDSKHKEYHSWLLQYIRSFQYSIPEGYRVCGEYLYAKHSIFYNNLKSYFQVFSVYDDNNICLSWDKTIEFCNERCLVTVPVLYEGMYDSDTTMKIASYIVQKGGEGIVVRNTDSFDYDNFNMNVAKYVRPNHVQTNEHWSHCKIEKNLLIS